MPAIAIATITPDQYSAVDSLVLQAYKHDYGPREESTDELRLAAIRSQTYDVWTAVDTNTGNLVGTITSSRPDGPRLHEDARADELDIRLLAVSPSYRRLGIGRALTLHIVDQARNAGLSGVFLKSGPDMVAAHKLYDNLGFSRDHARDGLFRNGEKLFHLFTYVYPLTDQAVA